METSKENFLKLASNASSAFEKQNYKEALGIYYSILALDIDNSITYCNIGIVNEILEEYELAVAFYKKAIRLDENNLQAVNNLAGLYIDTIKDFDIAYQYLDYIIKKEPNNPEAYNHLGRLSFLKKDYDLAEKYYKKSIFLDEKYFKNYYDIACIYIEIKENEKAKAMLDKCLSLNQDFYPATKLKNTLI